MNTQQSVCILGRQPALGLAELESLYGGANVVPVAEHAAGLTLPAAEVNFKRLGGSTRLGRVIATVPTTNWSAIEKQLSKEIVDIVKDFPTGSKVQLGLSGFGITISPAKLGAAGLTLKKVIRARTERSVRLVPNKELELNTASVLHNHLVGGSGVELLIIALSNGSTLLAQTVAVQDIESYTERDRERPKRDARVGMLPPKLAQIIINLAVADTPPSAECNVLDPFCGTGVVLQEAGLMGYMPHGTDLEPRMVDYSRTNMEWLMQSHPEIPGYEVGPGDATTTEWHTSEFADRPPLRIDAVAAETYLGRPFTARPGAEIIERTVSEVNLILKKFLRNIHTQLAENTRLCLAVPAWQTAPGRFRHLPLIDQLNEMGYNRIRFEHVPSEQLLYYREDQVVARELLVLTRK